MNSYPALKCRATFTTSLKGLLKAEDFCRGLLQGAGVYRFPVVSLADSLNHRLMNWQAFGLRQKDDFGKDYARNTTLRRNGLRVLRGGRVPAADLRAFAATADDFEVAIIGAGMNHPNLRLLVGFGGAIVGSVSVTVCRDVEELAGLGRLDKPHRLLGEVLLEK